jgi:hypothetical protein
LQHHAVQEKVIRNKHADFIIICNGQLEKVRIQGGHGWGEGSQQHEVRASAKAEVTGNMRRNDGGEKE